MPWLPPEHFEAPQGMLQRPESCLYPKRCAAARMCLAAHTRETAAHARHQRFLKRENGGEPAKLEMVPVAKKKTALEIIEEAIEAEFPDG
jgi:hypothetical protein